MVESHTEESVQKHILSLLEQHNTIEDTLKLSQDMSIDHKDLDKSLKSLLSDDYVSL